MKIMKKTGAILCLVMVMLMMTSTLCFGTEAGLKIRRITFLVLSAIAMILTFALGRHLVYAIFIIFTLYILMNLIHRVLAK